MKLIITINVDNAAFGDDGESREAEVNRILDHNKHCFGRVLEVGIDREFNLLDSNGNWVGFARTEETN